MNLDFLAYWVEHNTSEDIQDASLFLDILYPISLAVLKLGIVIVNLNIKHILFILGKYLVV